jgi:hypothetical protein
MSDSPEATAPKTESDKDRAAGTSDPAHSSTATNTSTDPSTERSDEPGNEGQARTPAELPTDGNGNGGGGDAGGGDDGYDGNGDGDYGDVAPIIAGPVKVDLSADLRNEVAKALAHKQEDTRTSLALGLLFLLCALAILSLIMVQFVGLEETTVTEGSKVTKTHTNIRMDAVVQQAQTLIAAVVGLVGSVIGFYFGARSKSGTD